MRKIITVIISILMVVMIAFFLVGCDNDEPIIEERKVEINTPLEAQEYFYDSLYLLCSSCDNLYIEISEASDNDLAQNMKSPFLIKQDNILYFTFKDTQMAYYDNALYYGPEFEYKAVIGLDKFIKVIFRLIYNEIEIERFLFSNQFLFNKENDDNLLTVEAPGVPHSYTMSLRTDSKHNFNSIDFIIKSEWLTKTIDIRITDNIDFSDMPSLKQLQKASIDMSTTISYFIDISSIICKLTENVGISKTSYQSDNNVYTDIIEEYMYKGYQAKLINSNGYNYYNNGILYTYGKDYEPEFNKKTYVEMPFNNIKFYLFKDAFELIRNININECIIREINDNTITYTNDNFIIILENNELNTIITKEYNSQLDKWNYNKRIYNIDIDNISAPEGFVIKDFIYYAVAEDIKTAKDALDITQNVLNDKYNNEDGMNPKLSDYQDKLYTTKVEIVTQSPTVQSMKDFTYYIHEIPSTIDQCGEIKAIYYKGYTGAYKAYYDECHEFVYDIMK